MARHDIMPLVYGSGGPNVRSGRLTASSSFYEGEPVNVVDAGTLSEAPQDTTIWAVADSDSANLGGIAAMDGDTTRTDGFARATGERISYYPWNEGTLFICKLFFATGDTTTVVVPVLTDIGESYEFAQGATAGIAGWGVEQTAGASGTAVQALIHDVLDANKKPIAAADTTGGTYLVFEIRCDEGKV